MGNLVAGAPAPAVLAAAALVLVTGAAIYRPALGLAVLAFAYPYDLTTHAGPVKLTTSALLLGIIVVVWAVRLSVPNPPARRKTPLDWPVVLFAAATALSLLSAFGPTGDLDDELTGLLKAAGGFLVFWLAVRSLDDRRDLWLVVGAVLATGFVQTAAVVIPALTGAQSVSAITRASGTTIDANLFAGYLVLIIPLVLAVGLVSSRRWVLPLTGAAFVIFSAGLVATLSRGGWLGLIAGIITLVALLPGKRRQIVILAAATAIILALAGLAGPVGARLGLIDQANLSTLLGRLPIWGAALQIFVQYPVFGVGVENFGNVVGWYNPALHVNHAHNLWLNIAAERGILGLAAFCLVLVAAFGTLATALRRALTATDRILAAGLIAAFTAFSVESLFEVSYYDYKILLLFWLLIGITASLPHLLGETPADQIRLPRTRWRLNP